MKSQHKSSTRSRSASARLPVLFQRPSPPPVEQSLPRRPAATRETEIRAFRSQILFNLTDDFADLERATLHLREGNRIDQITGANHGGKLTQIHLWNDYRFESGKNLTQILRERIQMTQVR